jgi:signal transduction histidine kinase
MTAQALAPVAPRLVRARSGRVLGGVASGLAQHLGVPVLWIRAAAVLLAVAGGSGFLLYAAYWLVLPLAEEEGGGRLDDRAWGEVAALVAIGAGAMLALQVLGVGLPGPGFLPLVVVGFGAALVWRSADDVRRARWRASASSRRGGLLMSLLGAGLLALGLAGFLATRGELQAAREGLLSTVVVVGGLVVLVAPWAVRTLGDLQAERRERIRSQERAELAAQVHDSVLQTLALIQQNAGDSREVARLARSQERELRTWLYRPSGPPSVLSAVLEQAAAEVEEAHGVAVEVVHVGDAPHDGVVVALASAAREAVVNAAKHSGADLVQVYAEVEVDTATVFVRDRGGGFDPDAVPADRYGLRESVVGRLERAGGTVVVRSAPGDGTEVRLQVRRG